MIGAVARAATTTDAFNAVAEPRRRQILDLLARGELPVNDLVGLIGLAQPLVSKHLRVLEDAGLVTKSKDAQRRPVHLEAEVFDLMTTWIERYRRQAEERYQRLDALLVDLPDETQGDVR